MSALAIRELRMLADGNPGLRGAIEDWIQRYTLRIGQTWELSPEALKGNIDIKEAATEVLFRRLGDALRPHVPVAIEQSFLEGGECLRVEVVVLK
jgi:hypothetical protein